MKPRYAIVSITRNGCRLGFEIHEKVSHDISEIDMFFPEKFRDDFKDVLEGSGAPVFFSEKVKDLLEKIFDKYEGIIAVISLGALIRLVAPLLRDKKTDPGVVVIDEKGEFVISALSGHVGGGNDLARLVAAKIGATPVITTASDVQKTIAVDLLGKTSGWVMEESRFLTEISAAVVNFEPVAIVQESGGDDWRPRDTPLAENLVVYGSLDEALRGPAKYFIVITHRELCEMPQYKKLFKNKYVIFRPPVIGLGIGCNRNTPAEEIEEVVKSTFKELKINLQSIGGAASIDLKKDEPGLLSFCAKFGIVPVFYSAEQLNRAKIENPSETVFKHTGAYGVSEPAARLLTHRDDLLLVKKISGNVTISAGLF